MGKNIYQLIKDNSKKSIKQLAVLIDPDKSDKKHLEKLLSKTNLIKIDYIFIGGSMLLNGTISETIERVKSICDKPLLIFPGSAQQICPAADAFLLLSLISGRNAELLIGKHVAAAVTLKKSGLELISTGYMLIDGGKESTVSYISGTKPIPDDKDGIAAVTALAAEQLGQKIIYMDAGSGAKKPISNSMIKSVKNSINLPLVIGGGIRTSSDLNNAWNAGADIVVIGNALEENPKLLAGI